ncbi:MAG: mandelate racemase/muconate lactonizing enzyme family protein [Pseudomonadota bacterium]
MPSTTIRSVRSLQLRLPFDHGAPAPLFAGRPRTTLDSVLVRVELEGGLVGWGESYGADLASVQSVIKNRIEPLAVGRDASDALLTATLDRTLHNMGRSGLVTHALSGLDIALWDVRGKAAGKPVYELLGGARRTRIPAYASLLQYYGDTALIRANVRRAMDAGYSQIKLHEKTAEAVTAAREVMGSHMPLMVDTNCAWTADAAPGMVRQMQASKPLWVEEPIWPPEDMDALLALRRAVDVPLAVGENASSAYELSALIRSGACDYLQPSAIKCGGLSTLWAMSQQCAGTAVTCSPQSAFFGPGFLATLHVLAAQSQVAVVERLYCELGFTPFASTIPFHNGSFELTDRPGLGADPEDELLNGPFVQ